MPFTVTLRHSLYLTALFFCYITTAQAQPKTAAQRLVFIGDAGKQDNTLNKVTAAAAQLSADGLKTTVLFLGNNVYPSGIPDSSDDGYAKATNTLQQLLTPFRQSKAQVYVLPGERDWQNTGPDGLDYMHHEAYFIDSVLNAANIAYAPINGCPGPQEINLGNNTILVLMDSQWWLHQFKKLTPGSDCPCKNEDEVVVRLKDIASRNRSKHIIVAMHHPLESYGRHGGHFTLKQHIFPLTDAFDGAYLPLPVVGSIYPVMRSAFGNQQDISHPEYQYLIKLVREGLSEAPDVTYVGAHDNNLQLIRDGNSDYIVSGAASTTDRVMKGRHSLFAAAQQGFAEIIIYTDGSRQINFYTIAPDGSKQLAYSNTPPAIALPNQPDESPATKQDFGTTATAPVAPEYDSVGSVHRFFFGNNYRKEWALPENMRVFYLAKEKGGLKILQKGGGFQTKSLRLQQQDKDSTEWVLRTLQKDPIKALPLNLRKTIAKPVLQDEISAGHPYAPLTLGIMEDALDIPHAHPEVVFVPDDPALGIYRADFANTACLLEEREPGKGENGKTYNTAKVLEKIGDDQDNVIDEQAVVRARLFDILIGDWDRHEDQWRWGKRKENGRDIYYPVPRDRDQAYFNNDGLVLELVSRKWIEPKYQGFKKKIRDVNGFTYNARYFDRFFMNELEEKDFTDAAAYIQETLTDSLIEAAIHQLPANIYAVHGDLILKKLKLRRNDLQHQASKFYHFLYKAVDIPGTDKHDQFTIQHLAGGDLEVTVQKIKKDGSLDSPYFHCTYRKGITQEIRLYGRDKDDIFLVQGSVRTPIRLRMVGGSGNDSFVIDPALHQMRKNIIYDRSDKQNYYPAHNQYLSRTSTDKTVNDYNGRAFVYNKVAPIGTAGYNADDGLLLGMGLHMTTHMFRKDPYASDQTLLIGHALSTKASFLRYNGDFRRMLGPYDLNVVIDSRAPDNTSNFFGIGNNTHYLKDSSIKYYRARYNVVNFKAQLAHQYTSRFKAHAGIIAQYYAMEEKENTTRFINTYESQIADQNIYNNKWFVGGTTGFDLDTRNDKHNPTRGLLWTAELSGSHKFSDGHNGYGQLISSATLYSSLRNYPSLIILNRLGGGLTFGQPLFYQLMYIGGTQNLRGYRNFRFAGNAMAYHNIEARIKLFDFDTYLFPGSLGLIAFNDVGRVWAHGESTGNWHDGYGGGIYITPAQLVSISGIIGHSKEGTFPYFTLGIGF